MRVNQREQIVQQTLTGFPCFLLFVISYLALPKDGVLFKFILQLNVRLLAVNGFKTILMLLNRSLITTKFCVLYNMTSFHLIIAIVIMLKNTD